MTSKITPRRNRQEEKDVPMDEVGSLASTSTTARNPDEKTQHIATEIGAKLKTPQGAILVPGSEIIKEAARKKDAIIASANAKADQIIEKSKAEASKDTEKTLQAASSKAEKEKERIIEEAHKKAKTVRAGNQADITAAAGPVFGKVFGDLF